MILIISTLLLSEEIETLQPDKKIKNRYEFSLTYNYLTDDYHDWKTATLGLYSKPKPTLNYYASLNGFLRDENSLIFSAGFSKDWFKRFYTNLGFTVGTESEYTPHYRFDGDMNFKLFKMQNLVLTLGCSYINFYDDHKNITIFGGPTFYKNKFQFVYNLHYNINYPGEVTSHTHIVSIGYGEDKNHWTFLTISYGNQAYLATYISNPYNVEQNVYGITLNHRYWLKDNFGIFGELTFLRIIDSHDNYGIKLGFFRNF